MGFAPRNEAGITIAAGETETVTFDNLGPHLQAICLAKAVLEAGAALAFSVEVRPIDATADWFDLKIVDLTGANEDALGASVAVNASATEALFALPYPAPCVRISIVNSGAAAATVDLWLLTS